MNFKNEKMILKKGLKKYAWQWVKTIIWCILTISLLIVITMHSKLLNFENAPIWCWGIAIILVAIPVIRYSLYRVIFAHSYVGKVYKCYDELQTDIGKKYVYGPWAMSSLRSVKQSDGYVVIVRDRLGLRHKYVFVGAEYAEYAREMFHEVDIFLDANILFR